MKRGIKEFIYVFSIKSKAVRRICLIEKIIANIYIYIYIYINVGMRLMMQLLQMVKYKFI